MFRLLFFLLVFYIIVKGVKIFIQMFKNNYKPNNYSTKKNSEIKDKKNIEDAEFIEIKSEIKKQNESK